MGKGSRPTQRTLALLWRTRLLQVRCGMSRGPRVGMTAGVHSDGVVYSRLACAVSAVGSRARFASAGRILRLPRRQCAPDEATIGHVLGGRLC